MTSRFHSDLKEFCMNIAEVIATFNIEANRQEAQAALAEHASLRCGYLHIAEHIRQAIAYINESLSDD